MVVKSLKNLFCSCFSGGRWYADCIRARGSRRIIRNVTFQLRGPYTVTKQKYIRCNCYLCISIGLQAAAEALASFFFVPTLIKFDISVFFVFPLPLSKKEIPTGTLLSRTTVEQLTKILVIVVFVDVVCCWFLTHANVSPLNMRTLSLFVIRIRCLHSIKMRIKCYYCCACLLMTYNVCTYRPWNHVYIHAKR